METKENKLEKNEENQKIDDQINYFKYAFENVQKLAEFADAKATTLLTIHAVTVTIMSAALFLDEVRSKINTDCDLFIGLIILSFLMASVYFSISVIKPRDAKNDESLFYYQKIADFTNEDEYYKSFDKLEKNDVVKAFAHQSYHVSSVVNEKMRCVKRSLNLFLVYLISLVVGSLIIFYN